MMWIVYYLLVYLIIFCWHYYITIHKPFHNSTKSSFDLRLCFICTMLIEQNSKFFLLNPFLCKRRGAAYGRMAFLQYNRQNGPNYNMSHWGKLKRRQIYVTQTNHSTPHVRGRRYGTWYMVAKFMATEHGYLHENPIFPDFPVPEQFFFRNAQNGVIPRSIQI